MIQVPVRFAKTSSSISLGVSHFLGEFLAFSSLTERMMEHGAISTPISWRMMSYLLLFYGPLSFIYLSIYFELDAVLIHVGGNMTFLFYFCIVGFSLGGSG